MLSPRNATQALKALLEVRAAETARLERIRDALSPRTDASGYHPTVQVPANAPLLMRELARKSETNYLPLLIKTFGQVIKADGYTSDTDPAPARPPWWWWQRNRMDARQTGLHRSALAYGTGYATVLPGTWPGSDLTGPHIQLYTPFTCTALYDDSYDTDWPISALVSGDGWARLIDEEAVYYFGVEHGGRPWWDQWRAAHTGPDNLTFLEARPHGLGICPLIRYRDRNLIGGEEHLGIVEPLITIQERIQETTFELMVTQYFQAFRQRYVIGWMPETEMEQVKASAAQIWYNDVDPADVKLGEWSPSDITPYLESAAAAKRDFAAIGQIPAQAMGVDGISNISDATLAGLEAAKNREAGEITTSLGESHEQMLRLCAWIDGNQSAADDVTGEIKWKDFEARSYAATVDGLVKLAQGLGLPPEILAEDIPGMTSQRLERITAGMRRTAAAKLVADLSRSRDGNPGPS